MPMDATGIRPVPPELELRAIVSHPTWMLGAELMAFANHLPATEQHLLENTMVNEGMKKQL